MSKRAILAVLPVVAAALVAVAPATATAGKGLLFHDGDVVRTVVPPAAFPHAGTDPFFEVLGGADGQLGIASVAPGDPGYHGGHWAVYDVTWNTTPYLLTSADAVQQAQLAGDVDVTRVPGADFLCPVQP